MVNKSTDVCSMKLLYTVLYLDTGAVLYAQEPGSFFRSLWGELEKKDILGCWYSLLLDNIVFFIGPKQKFKK